MMGRKTANKAITIQRGTSRKALGGGVRSSAVEYLTYVAATGESHASVEMRYEDENIWLTQKMMAALYDVDVRTVNEHIQKIYQDAELSEGATIRNFRIVQTEGARQVEREVTQYNLQMLIAVGFKVNNERAVQFRKWANTIVKDYIPMTMQDWEVRLNRFIEMTDHAVLQDAGRVTAELAKEFAESEFEKYRIVQDRLFKSDFDKLVEATKTKAGKQ
jgi:hypothetical protein